MTRVVLDVYDDHGRLLREKGLDWAVPLWIKEANDPSSCADDQFALVVRTPGGTLRKFACNDQANTILSAVYFRETRNHLPQNLQKIAARKLAAAFAWHGMEPPQDILKLADVSGTPLAPYQPTPNMEDAERSDLERGIQAIKTPNQGKNVARVKMEAKAASIYADTVNRRFPLDSVEQVLTASRYMDKYAAEIEPRQKRMMALNIRKRADELHLPLGKTVRELTQVKVASTDTIKGHLEVRADFYGRNTKPGRLMLGLMDKVGSIRPSVLAETIAQIDEMYDGKPYWGSHLPDPWEVVYTKVAEDAHTYSYDIGGKRISGDDLVRLAKMDRKRVQDRFGREFADQFVADPVGFFDHLPLPEKKVLMNMAHDAYAPPFASPLKA